MSNSKMAQFNNGVKNGLPIGLGYLSVSFAFGAQASILGIPWFMSVFISMTNLTSAGQLAGITIIATFGTILEMILTQLVINARYFLMSITLSQKMDNSFSLKHRFLCAAFVTDEIFAVASSRPKTFSKPFFFGLVILPYFGWALGTLLGGIAADLMPSQVTNALGLALYAMFIAIIIPPSTKSKGVFVAVAIATATSCALYFIPVLNSLSEGMRYIISALLSASITAFIFPVKIESEQDESKTNAEVN